MKKPKKPKVGQTSPTHPCPAENLPCSHRPKQKLGDGENASLISSHITLCSSGCKSGYGASTELAVGLGISCAEAGVPRRPKSRLIPESYHLLPDTLPNGLPRTPPILGTAILVLGGDFRIQAEVRRNKNGELFVVRYENAYDTVLENYVPLDITLHQMQEIYELTMLAHIAAVARSSAQGTKS